MENDKACQHHIVKSVPVEVRESVIPSVAQQLAQSILDDVYFTVNEGE